MKDAPYFFFIFLRNFPVVQIDVADVADRLATTATVLFAVTAYQFAIMEMVPSGGTDQSLVDKYVLFTTILIVTSLGETFFLGVAMNDWELSEESAVNIDTWFFASNPEFCLNSSSPFLFLHAFQNIFFFNLKKNQNLPIESKCGILRYGI